ncbi:MAG TPA: hypothetical protein VNO55_24725 [Polyangia bacterium]|nr:hypothetical protein [Polyangia bacterium]
MKARLFLSLCLLIPTGVGSCFRPNYECSVCDDTTRFCPSSLICENNYCVSAKGQVCNADAAANPDPLLCQDQCCAGGECFSFSPHLQNGLLLWADRVSLGPQGFPAPTWHDRSMAANHISASDPAFAPVVQRDPVGSLLELHDSRIQLATPGGPGLRLGTDDFTLLILARCDADGTQSTLFDKGGLSRPRAEVVLYCNHTPSPTVPPKLKIPSYAVLLVLDEVRQATLDDGLVSSNRYDLPGDLHLYGVRRVGGTSVQLRIDGVVEAEVSVAASLNFAEAENDPLRIASQIPINSFLGGVAAVVVVRGPMTDQEVTDLESFLIRRLGKGAPAL